MRVNYRPLQSLRVGRWFKLICGASYQHLPAIRNLALAYALAGADCIDVAADPAVVGIVKESLDIVSYLRHESDFLAEKGIVIPSERPFLMVSFSDGDDPHFRKASFDPDRCPPDCLRPCEAICPASAIAFNDSQTGILEERCYGCGRCLPICPIQQIETVTRATSVDAIAPQLLSQVDAIEIHTQVGRYEDFMALWSVIKPYVEKLKIVSVSCPDHPSVIDYLWQIHTAIQPLPIPLIWQTDGRPMSGDIGKGTTHATLRYAYRMLQAGPPGFVQLAGGTNAHTVTKLGQLIHGDHFAKSASPHSEITSQLSKPSFGGIAYGSFARRLLAPLLDELLARQSSGFVSTAPSPIRNAFHGLDHLEVSTHSLAKAVQLAQSLVAPLKAAHSVAPLHALKERGSRFSGAVACPNLPPYSSSFE